MYGDSKAVEHIMRFSVVYSEKTLKGMSIPKIFDLSKGYKCLDKTLVIVHKRHSNMYYETM